jgi:hypothetical protein
MYDSDVDDACSLCVFSVAIEHTRAREVKMDNFILIQKSITFQYPVTDASNSMLLSVFQALFRHVYPVASF